MTVTRRLAAALLACLLLAACQGSEGPYVSAPLPPPYSPVQPPEDLLDPTEPFHYTLTGSVRDWPQWLGRYLWWTTLPEDGGWQLHLLDTDTGKEQVVLRGEGIPSLTPALSRDGERLELTLREGEREGEGDDAFYRRVALDTGDWSIVEDRRLPLAASVSPAQWSSQGTVVELRPSPDGAGQEVLLYPMESPEEVTRLRDRQGTRYSLSGTVWSPSGEYFLLRNDDARGMERFGSLAELRAHPLSEWPRELQYDVFHKDGSFAWSFCTDLVSPGAGGMSSGYFLWLPGDRLLLCDTSRDAEDRPLHTWERLLDSRGRRVWEDDYDGEARQYRQDNAWKQELWYQEDSEEGVRVMILSLDTGERWEYGVVAPGKNGGWVDILGCGPLLVLDRERRELTVLPYFIGV